MFLLIFLPHFEEKKLEKVKKQICKGKLLVKIYDSPLQILLAILIVIENDDIQFKVNY